ncbi:MAG: alkaline phosphatase [Clostridia bacterium]|nr:alkaline phosphatase [Clostridia bacterium]
MKRILSLILCLFLILSLVACGQKDKGTNNSQTGSDVSSTITSSDASSSDNSSTDSSDSGSSSGSSSEDTSSEEESIIVPMDSKYKADNDAILTKAQLDKALKTKYTKPKNVIIMIGDGMGLSDVAISAKFSDFKFEYGLAFTQLPNVGKAETNSLSGTTDSAASGTALATGKKTHNGYVGMNNKGLPIENVSEIARKNGKLVGVVTNDGISGATPAAFIAHNISRNNASEIRKDYVTFAPDVLIGKGSLSSFQDSVRGNATLENTLANYNVVTAITDFISTIKGDTKREKKFLGLTSTVNFGSPNYDLATATQAALDRLDNDDKGFFLMVENTGCDSYGHNTDAEHLKRVKGKVLNPALLDKAVAVAIKYCMNNPDTILIITSDHETGGVSLPNKVNYELDQVKFAHGAHSSQNVGVFAMGYGTEYFKNKTVDNTDIGKFIIAAVQGQQYKGE